ncbi:MAG: transposase, partial [Desulfovibrio sp.]|nr:transposase [Desulfovibrio sp.]
GVSTDLMNLYLKELSEFLGDREIILVMDNAGWHRSKALVVPWNITLHYLPPYTPEPGPVERVWRILKRDCLRKRYYEDVDEIMDVFQEWFRARSRRSYRALCHCDHLVNSIL